jgi:uncharacterized protein YfbU (UPF0304 family)
MKLSDGEKLILVMLSEVYKHLRIEGEINPDLVLASVFGDKAWGLRWEYSGLFNSPEESPPVVQETCDILDMYRMLTRSYEKMSPDDKKRVETEAAPFNDYLKFQGFDGNNDEHFGVVSYLVRHLGKYDELRPGDLNSHSISTLRTYRRKLETYKPMVEDVLKLSDGLTADQIIKILKPAPGSRAARAAPPID